MAISNTFDFIGTYRAGKNPVETRESASGWVQKSLKASINETNNNGMFLTLQGGYSTKNANKVLTFTKGLFGERGNKLEVGWDDRFNQSTVNQVSDFKKIVVDTTEDAELKSKYWDLRKEVGNLERKEDPTQEDKIKLAELYTKLNEIAPERKEFIHPFDAIEYIEANLEKFDKKRFRVRGAIEVSYWNEKFYTNYVVQSIELVINEEIPNKLEGEVDLYFGKSALDKSLWGKEKKLLFDTYINCYDRGHKKNVLMPYKSVFDGANFDIEENPKQKAYVALLGKIFTTKGKVVNHMPFNVKMVNGAEEVEFDESKLSEEQQLLIDAGIATIDDYKSTVFGERVQEVKLMMPILKDLGDNGNFTTGALESEYNNEDLEYTPAENTYSAPKEKVDEIDIIEIDSSELPF